MIKPKYPLPRLTQQEADKLKKDVDTITQLINNIGPETDTLLAIRKLNKLLGK